MLHVRSGIVYTFFISLSIAQAARSTLSTDPLRIPNPFSRAIESEEYLKEAARFTGIAKARVMNVFGLCARPELLQNIDFREYLESTGELEFDAVAKILANFKEAEKVDDEYYQTLADHLAFLRATRNALRKTLCVDEAKYNEFQRLAHEIPLTPENVFKVFKEGTGALDPAVNFYLRLRLSETTADQMNAIESYAAERKDAVVIAKVEEMKVWWLMLRSETPPINVKIAGRAAVKVIE